MAASATMISASPAGRVSRRPSHPFYIQHRPFEIQPFMIAPVLPGETMKNLLLQARAVTDPITNPLIGWWLEYYVFYVKHRDLDDRDELTQMMLDGSWTPVNIDDPTSVTAHGFVGTNVNYVQKCLKRVVEEYFRDEGEAWNNVSITTGIPVAAINRKDFTDSAHLNDVVPDGTLVNEGGTGTLGNSELDVAQAQWEFLRANQLINMSYEDYLRTFGVRTGRAELHRPELIRYVREWQYPSSTISPTDGVPSAAVSWAVSERADKDRYFTEPGFIFGVTVARPKVYILQDGSVTQYMSTAFDWLPALMRDEVWTSLKKFTATGGPLQSVVTDADGYWIDIRDLFVHGEQFTNLWTAAQLSDNKESTAWFPNVVDLPNAALSNKVYPSAADADAAFLYAAAGRKHIRQDGVVSLNILGTQRDHT